MAAASGIVEGGGGKKRRATRVLRFVILEDHPLVREALADRLVSGLDDVDFVYVGADVDTAVARIDESGADCVVLDLDLGDNRPPVSHVHDLVEAGSSVLVVSALGDRGTIRAALTAGACGYISKSAPSDEFLTAVRAVAAGENYTSPEIAAVLLSGPQPAVALSAQEQRAMALYASGLKMSAVARRMGISEGTAQEYIKRVRAKYLRAGTPARTKTDLYRIAQREGFL